MGVSTGMALLASGALSAGMSLVSANQQKQAAKGAAAAQERAAQSGIREEQRQFEAIQALLAPYVESGTSAIEAQKGLLGLYGEEAQQKGISEIESSPQYRAIVKQGENAILQRASATGGLRGGNVQAALSQFRPQILSQLIEQQYGRLGQMASLGQASAAGQAAMGQQQGVNIAGLLGQIGQAQAGGYLAQGAANAALPGTISKFGGTLASLAGKW